MKTITYDEFSQVDLRTGTIVKAEIFARAKKPAYKLWVNFGDTIGVKKSSAQITEHYSAEILIGKQVIGCINLGTKNIGGFISECLIVGFADKNGAICLATVDGEVENGQKLF